MEGDVLITNRKEALVRIASDSSMGRHDSHLPASIEAEDILREALEKEVLCHVFPPPQLLP